eukprot:CAMPEP_0197900262 /NCGR_PEP_ID=MMETSP1439-20131203/48701_1 /TAXON_ID=66791 /ORGANISM="Gonyaulax spinifera, Strain CCMP409" /LENGTH=53 /DNA_ID=CAMNT_0043521131 /DNA_START=67 /DNA_END=224 /DNA_ORIENTATION=-
MVMAPCFRVRTHADLLSIMLRLPLLSKACGAQEPNDVNAASHMRAEFATVEVG